MQNVGDLEVMEGFCRFRVSDGNPFPDSLLRTLKYYLRFPWVPFGASHEAEALSGGLCGLMQHRVPMWLYLLSISVINPTG